MHRIDSTSKADDLFGAGKDGYTEGDPELDIPATQTTADHFNALQEELAAPIEAMGLALSKGDNTQLLASMKRLQRLFAASNWNERATGLGVSLESLAVNAAGELVAVGAPTGGFAAILSSDDGITWTLQTNTSTVQLNAVVYSEALLLWCAVGKTMSGASVVLTSPDRVTWTAQTSGATAELRGLAVSDTGVFVAVGIAGWLIYSADGITWSLGTSGTIEDLNGCTWAGGKFIAVGDNGLILSASVASGTWTQRNTSVGDHLLSVAFNGTRWCAVGLTGASAHSWVSTDGVTWTNTLGFIAGFTLRAVAADADGLFIATGGAGVLRFSRDGVNWTAVASPTASSVHDVAWCATLGGYWVAVHAGGKALNSLHALA